MKRTYTFDETEVMDALLQHNELEDDGRCTAENSSMKVRVHAGMSRDGEDIISSITIEVVS